MANNHVSILNGKRRTIRARMSRDAKNYAAASAKLLSAMEKLSKEDLSVFLKKNPDVLLDIAGGVVSKVGSRAKNAASNVLHEFKKDLNDARTKGTKKGLGLSAELEKKGIGYIKKLLSL